MVGAHWNGQLFATMLDYMEWDARRAHSYTATLTQSRPHTLKPRTATRSKWTTQQKPLSATTREKVFASVQQMSNLMLIHSIACVQINLIVLWTANDSVRSEKLAARISVKHRRNAKSEKYRKTAAATSGKKRFVCYLFAVHGREITYRRDSAHQATPFSTFAGQFKRNCTSTGDRNAGWSGPQRALLCAGMDTVIWIFGGTPTTAGRRNVNELSRAHGMSRKTFCHFRRCTVCSEPPI